MFKKSWAELFRVEATLMQAGMLALQSRAILPFCLENGTRSLPLPVLTGKENDFERLSR